MTSLRKGKGIIRGAQVDGVVFCNPSGQLETQQEHEHQEKENLKALEDFWQSKGQQTGHKEGFEEGFQEGEKEGHRKGLQQGLQQGCEEGDQAGYERGKAEGRETAQEEFAKGIDLLREAAEKMHLQQEGIVDTARQEIIHFCMSVCENLLQRELSDPKAFSGLVEQLLARARSITKEGNVDIFFAPEDYTMMQSHFDAIRAGADDDADADVAERVRFYVDESLPEKDCRVETSLGLLHFAIKRQLDDLEKKVLEVEGESCEANTPGFTEMS